MSDTPQSGPLPAQSSTQPALGREVLTVFRHEFRHLLLSVRTLLPMGIYAGFGAMSVLVYLQAVRMAESEATKQFGAAAVAEGKGSQQVIEELVGKVLEGTGWGTTGDAAEIFRDQVPLLFIFFFPLASYFLPLLVAIVSFDQFSELSTRGARFALLRVRRVSYFAGKALAAAASVSAFLAVTWLLVGVVAMARTEEVSMMIIAREAVRAWALSSVLALPYLSLTALISSMARPGLAFLGVFGAWIGLSIGSSLVGTVFPWLLTEKMDSPELAETVRGLSILFPWDHAPKLLSRHDPTLVGGIGGLIIFAAAGYLSAVLYVRRRDV